MARRALDSLTAISGSSSSSSSDSDTGDEEEEANSRAGGGGGGGGGGAAVSQRKGAEKGGVGCKKAKIDFEALSRLGYTGGPSILHVPAPRQETGEQNWSWGNGKRDGEEQQAGESIEERELNREIANERTMKMATASLAESAFAKQQRRDAIAEQKALSFSQKEKRKRDLGQASRGKSYVEEEKRLLRDSGVYSGFDT